MPAMKTTQARLNYYIGIGKAMRIQMPLKDKSKFKPAIYILGTKTVSGNYRGFCNIGAATLAEQRFFIKEVIPNFPGVDIKAVATAKEVDAVVEDCELSLTYINRSHFPEHVLKAIDNN